MATRKLENWLKTFRDWSLPRSEASEQFVFWAGLFCLSTALRRKVWIPKSILGGWECTPHLYIMFVAPPGHRKTVTIREFSSVLLDQIPEIRKGPTITTATFITDELIKDNHSSVYLVVEEFGDVIMKGGLEMYEYLTSMFDGKVDLVQGTMLRGREIAERPCINMVAGTTPRWISAKMPAEAIGGGFASRVIFIYSDKLRNKQMYYRKKFIDIGGSKQFLELERDLVHDLAIIATSVEGEFDLTSEAEEFGENWYQNLEAQGGDKLQGYLMRKHVHVHKVAMLVHVAYSSDRLLQKSDLEAAIKIIESTEETLPKVFEGVGKNPYTFDVKDIIEYVAMNEGVSESNLLRHFESVATPGVLNELISQALLVELLKTDMDKDNKRIYSLGAALKSENGKSESD